jgi:hypothetical protein
MNLQNREDFTNLQDGRNLSNYASNLTSQDLYGLFELDATGTVLYSRVRYNNRLINAKPDWIGQNYFEEIAPFENTREFRRRFMNFVQGTQTAESFTFECRFQEMVVPVKVLMAGAYESGSGKPANIIILDIRRF